MFKIRLNNQSTGPFPKGREVRGGEQGKDGGRERKKGEGRERKKEEPKDDKYICVYPTNELYAKYESRYYPLVIKRHNKNVVIRLLPNYKVSRDLDQYFTKRTHRGS